VGGIKPAYFGQGLLESLVHSQRSALIRILNKITRICGCSRDLSLSPTGSVPTRNGFLLIGVFRSMTHENKPAMPCMNRLARWTTSQNRFRNCVCLPP